MSGLYRKHFFAGIIGIVLGFALMGCLLNDEADQPFDGVELDTTSVILYLNTATPDLGNQIILTATVSPANAPNAVVWASSNPAVAAVNQGGLVTAVGPGTAVIGVTTGYGGFSAVCAVMVVDLKGTGDPVQVTGVSVDIKNLEMSLADTSLTRLLGAEVTPPDASISSVTWSTGNPAVATVNKDGLVTAVGPGIAVITVTTVSGGFTDICTVKVNSVLSGSIEITENSNPVGTEAVVIYMGPAGNTFTANLTPQTESVSYIWTIPDDAVIGIKDTAAGVLTAEGASVTIIGKSEGDVIVRVNAVQGSAMTLPAFFTIRVIDPSSPPDDIMVTTGGKMIAQDEVITFPRLTEQIFKVTANRAIGYEWIIDVGGDEYIGFKNIADMTAETSLVTITGKESSNDETVTVTVKGINGNGNVSMSFMVKVLPTTIWKWSYAEDDWGDVISNSREQNGKTFRANTNMPIDDSYTGIILSNRMYIGGPTIGENASSIVVRDSGGEFDFSGANKIRVTVVLETISPLTASARNLRVLVNNNTGGQDNCVHSNSLVGMAARAVGATGEFIVTGTFDPSAAVLTAAFTAAYPGVTIQDVLAKSFIGITFDGTNASNGGPVVVKSVLVEYAVSE